VSDKIDNYDSQDSAGDNGGGRHRIYSLDRPSIITPSGSRLLHTFT
jgi:hypothetical protein